MVEGFTVGQTFLQRIGDLLCHFVKREEGRRTLIEIMSYDDFRKEAK